MSNSFYNHSTYPAPNGPGSSAALRSELDLISAGFDKLPTLSGNAYKVAMVNAAGTALVASSALQGLTIDNSPIGATTAASGRFTTVTATSGITGNVTGNLTGNVTSAGTSTFNDVVIGGSLDLNSLTAGTITGLNDPTNNSDAANKNYVDTRVNTRLATAGGTMSGAIAMGNNKITGLGNPTSAQDAATKTYIDTLFGSTTDAATSAAAAASSATAASNSATSASTSASSASTSATNAAASYDSFDDRYLGPKTSNPSTDNDGNALLTGAIYWNSTASEMRVWNGSAWLSTYLPAGSYLLKTGDTMTGNLTVNTGTDSRVLLQVSGTNQAQFQATASAIRLASNNTTPLVLAVDGVDRATLDNAGNVTFGSVSASGVFKVQGLNTGDLVVFESTDASATAAPDVVLYRNSASPAAADQIANLLFRGKDSGGSDQSYARILATIVDPTAGVETGDLRFGVQTLGGFQDLMTLSSAGLVASSYKETRIAMAANDINLSSANYFTKTISGATTLTVSNVPTTGTAASFILDLTNGGSAAITWWSGVKWAGGTAPTLTASGRDVLGFFTHDGGTTWSGLVLGKDVK